MFGAVTVGDRTAPHFLGNAIPIHVGAAHMGIRRHTLFIELHRIFLGTAKHVFLLVHRQLIE